MWNQQPPNPSPFYWAREEEVSVPKTQFLKMADGQGRTHYNVGNGYEVTNQVSYFEGHRCIGTRAVSKIEVMEFRTPCQTHPAPHRTSIDASTNTGRTNSSDRRSFSTAFGSAGQSSSKASSKRFAPSSAAGSSSASGSSSANNGKEKSFGAVSTKK